MPSTASPPTRLAIRGLHPSALPVDVDEADLELDGAVRCRARTDARQLERRRRRGRPRPRRRRSACRSSRRPVYRACSVRPGAGVLDPPALVDQHHDVARVLDHRRQPVLALLLGEHSDPGDEAPHPRQCEHDDDHDAATDDDHAIVDSAAEVGQRQCEQDGQRREHGDAEPDDPADAHAIPAHRAGEWVSAIVGSSAAAARTSGAATDSAAGETHRARTSRGAPGRCA